jgi:hypothetical protein
MFHFPSKYSSHRIYQIVENWTSDPRLPPRFNSCNERQYRLACARSITKTVLTPRLALCEVLCGVPTKSSRFPPHPLQSSIPTCQETLGKKYNTLSSSNQCQCPSLAPTPLATDLALSELPSISMIPHFKAVNYFISRKCGARKKMCASDINQFSSHKSQLAPLRNAKCYLQCSIPLKQH